MNQRVAVCIATYRRPEGLACLLDSILALRYREKAPELSIVVVDNDPSGSAGPVCEAPRGRFDAAGIRLISAAEPEPGISQARNRAIATALERIDDLAFIVFVDDDERVHEAWLDELLRVQRAYEADVVAGPVLSEFDEGAPAWAERSGVYARRRHATGTALAQAATGNVLIRADVLRAMDRHFDERLGLVGGEDKHFFLRMSSDGYRIVWADEAIATERVPPERMTFGWVMRRALRLGGATVYVNREVGGFWKSAPHAIAVGAYRILKGLVTLPFAAIAGPHRTVVALRHLTYGLGLWAGLLGIRYREYKRASPAR